jgi:hypothetical protein
MKTVGLFFIAMVTIGCHHPMYFDTTPPSPPQGIIATAMDNSVKLEWFENQEPDVEGYKIWVSDRYDGKYVVIGSTHDIKFMDVGATNGVRAYYAVTAYDFDRNESDLSKDVVYATPRPEGYGTKINDFRTSPSSAGYDFSTYSVGNFDDDFTDVYFESYNGRFYLDVWKDTDIQDMGYTSSLYEIAVAPAGGWAPSKSVEAIPGHSYVIWTWDDHYAKVRVREVTPLRVTFDWSYQVAQTNPELKRQVAADGSRLIHPQQIVRATK